MGFFSSKIKTYVNTTVQRVFEDTSLPDSAIAGVMRGILSGEDMNMFIMEELVGSLGVRANRGFQWAQRNNYETGLPTGAVNSVVAAKSIVLSTIAQAVGQTITADYYKFGPTNTIHYGWTYLVANFGYNPATNELRGKSAVMGRPCYLTNMQATYPLDQYNDIMNRHDYEMLAQWGPAPSSGYTPTNPFNYLGGIGQYAAQSNFVVSDSATEDFITVTWEYVGDDGKPVYNTFTITIPDEMNEDHHQVRYLRADGVYDFWTYREGAGTYPDIDGVYAMDFNDLGTYLPWAYFRHNDKRVSIYFPSEATQHTKWLKYLGVDYEEVDKGVHDDPDVGDVEQAFMMFGVWPGGQSEDELTYLFEYFSILHNNSLAQIEMADNLEEKFGVYSNSPSQLQLIQDKVFQMTFQFSGITKRRTPGKIAALNKFTGSYDPAKAGGTGEQPQPAFIYRKQVMDSMYEEVVVYNLSVHYQITTKKGFSAGGNAPELLVPVDRAILGSLSMRNKERLLARSLQMVVNTKVQVKTPWYASTWFRAVMIVVAIVVTILSAGSAWASVVAAATIGMTALAITVLTYILTAVVINYATKIFVKAVGPQLGFIVAVAAMAYAGYTASGIPGESTWGENMLAIGNNLAKQSNIMQQDMLEDIQQKTLDFQDYAKGMYDSLKEKREELGLEGQTNIIDALDIVTLSPMTLWDESPSDFYARTVHSGNIGATSYDVAAGFVDHMLTLPTIDDTIIEVPDGIPE